MSENNHSDQNNTSKESNGRSRGTPNKSGSRSNGKSKSSGEGSRKSIAPSEVKLGEEVSFYRHSTARGLSASSVTYTTPEQKISKDGIIGTIVRDADAYRGAFGLIEVAPVEGDPVPPGHIPFLFDDAQPGQKKLMKKGTQVIFTLTTIPNTNYYRAVGMKLLQKKKKQAAASGASAGGAGAEKAPLPKEQGHVETLHGDYGFISSAERAGVQLYFKFEDLVDKDVKLKERMELEFEVIRDNSKGKFNDRAVRVKVLPAGSIQVEVLMACEVVGVVIEQPKERPQEAPGTLRLLSAVQADGHPLVQEIEIWSRCCPSGFACRVGDTLIVNVIYYCPEKLYFARDVRVQAFRKIGREYGKVCRVKEHGFGFIHSAVREADVYFRTNEVIGPDGKFMREAAVTQDMVVSFEVVLEETSRSSGSSSKLSLRAVCVQSDEGQSGQSATSRTILKRAGMLGVVVREPRKEAPGLIRATSNTNELVPSDEDLILDIVEGLTEFISLPTLKEVVIESLLPQQRRLYYLVLDQKFFNVAYETLGPADAKRRALKVWKLNDSEYLKWRTTKSPNPVYEQVTSTKKSGSGTKENADKISSNPPVADSGPNPAPASDDNIDGTHLFFLKSDVNTDVGPVVKDRLVTFDMHLDRRTGRMVAKAVSLTDVPADNVEGEVLESTGVVSVSRNSKSAFIRVVGTDEKLAWVNEHAGEKPSLADGTEVSFEVRVRGGLRCALNVKQLREGTLRKEEVLDGFCTALVIDDLHVVLTDVWECALLAHKYVDLVKAVQSLGKGAAGKTAVFAASAPTGPTPAGSTTSSTSTPTESTAVDGKAGGSERKYFGTLLRVPIAMEVPKDRRNRDRLVVGALVRCRVVVDWALQRYPLRVCDVTPVESTPVQQFRRGTVIKVKLPLSLSSSSEHLFLHEVIEAVTDSNSFVPGEVGHFFLDSREGHGLSGGELRRGDVVRFMAIPGSKVAVAVSYLGTGAAALIPPPPPAAASASTTTDTAASVKEEGGIVFKRMPVNAELKKAGGAGAKGVVTMAQGPPNSEAVGFAKKWREHPVTSELPWGHLLPI